MGNFRDVRVKSAKISVYGISNLRMLSDIIGFPYEEYLEKFEEYFLDMKIQRRKETTSTTMELSFEFFVGDNVYMPEVGFWTVSAGELISVIAGIFNLAKEVFSGCHINLYVKQVVVVPYTSGMDNETASNIISDLEDYIKEELSRIFSKEGYQVEVVTTNCGEGYWEETKTSWFGCDLEIMIYC